MKKIMGLLIASVVASSMAMADQTTIRISGDAVSLYLDPTPSATNSAQFGFLYNNDDHYYVLDGGLFANGRRQNFSGRLGAKVYYADLDKTSGFGIALGGDFNFTLAPQLVLNAGLFYSPGSLTFSDLNQYKEWFVKVNYSVFDTAKLGIGYGSLKMDPKKGPNIRVDQGIFAEMNLLF